MIKIQETGIVLSADSKEYDFNGNKGVSNKIRFAVDGEIYPIKGTKEQITDLQEYVGSKAELTFNLVSIKENITLRLESIDPAV